MNYSYMHIFTVLNILHADNYSTDSTIFKSRLIIKFYLPEINVISASSAALLAEL